MDTVTQMILGGAVGELALGKKVGNKAVLWGAVAGIIPDLDMLALPFLDPISQMAFHRSFTHSLLFALVLAPVLSYLVFRLYKGREASWKAWSLLFFWSTVTHPMLDIFTTYGTEFFWPFSKYRIALSSIHVIDPLYSLPFALCLLGVLFLHRKSKFRRRLNAFGLILSTGYLLFTFGNKQMMTRSFVNQLQAQNIQFSRLLTSPTPLNNILWRGIAETRNGFYEGYLSWFSRSGEMKFDFIPQNNKLLESIRNNNKIKELAFLTKEFYAVSEENGSLFVHDMRYGRMNGWSDNKGGYIFSFKVDEPAVQNREQLHLSRERMSLKINRAVFIGLFRKIAGE